MRSSLGSLIMTIAILLVSCQNYNSEHYIGMENQAINDLIPEMTDLIDMIRMNDLDTTSLKLLLVSTLNNSTSTIIKPDDGYTVAIDGNRLSPKEILQNEIRHKEQWEEYEIELKLFSRLINKEIKTRPLKYEFDYSNLEVELTPNNQVQLSDLDGNEFGYLWISRILFTNNFETGHMSYSFYCGQGCVWDNNVEIKKVQDKWTIVKYYSGGIA